ncbi:MAG: hypothetical protein ACTHL8_01040 [Burkholderiaceae bacterium]
MHLNTPHYRTDRLEVAPDAPQVVDVAHWRHPILAVAAPGTKGSLLVEVSVTPSAAQEPDAALWGALSPELETPTAFEIPQHVAAVRLSAKRATAHAEIVG